MGCIPGVLIIAVLGMAASTASFGADGVAPAHAPSAATPQRNPAPERTRSTATEEPPLADLGNVLLSRGKDGSGQTPAISGLSWNQRRSRLEIREPKPGALDPTIILYGNFGNKDGSLLCHMKKVAVSEKGDFRLLLSARHAREKLELTAIGIRGDIEREILVIDSPGLQALLKEAKEGRVKSSGPFSGLGFSLGYTSLSYDQAGVHLDESLLTAKASYTRAFQQIIGVVNAFGTVLPLGTSGEATTLRFVGVNARAGHAFSLGKEWVFGPSAGYYYTTTFSTNGLGYKNEQGPEVFFAVGRNFGARSFAEFTAKQAYVMTGIGGIASNYEIAFGASYTRYTAGGHSLSVGVDWADLRATAVNGQFSSRSISLGVGYGW